MSPASLVHLVLLAACWGSAFLFVRVAAPAVGPVMLVEWRVLLGGLLLLAWARWLGHAPRFARHWRLYVGLGALNSAFPFALVSWAVLHLEASFAAVLVATAPLFGALLAHLTGEERLRPRKALGLVGGVIGVAVLLGWSPQGAEDPLRWAAVAAAMGAACLYAFAAAYSRRHAGAASGPVLAAGCQLGAAALLLLMLPLDALIAGPATAPLTPAVIGSMAALVLFSSALAFILYFRLIADVGPVRTLTVNFLAPLFGVAGGVLALDEPLTPAIGAGTAIILAGMWLVLTPGGAKAPPNGR